MYTSFFKREPTTNITLPIHRISKAISENKQTKRACLPRSLSVNRELTVLCQYAEFQKQVVKINTEDKHREACSFFKRKPQGKYESINICKGHKIYPKELCWIWLSSAIHRTIDLIHKWLPIYYSFGLVQISLPSFIAKNSCSKVRLGRLICTITERK